MNAIGSAPPPPAEAAGPGTVLALRDVNTFRGPAHVLRKVSVSVRNGETVCLVGRNGAGKTTTMDSIMGLLPVRSGAVVYRGREITALGRLDEAFEGLAPAVVNRFADAVRKIQAMGISMLIAESNVMSAAKVADRLCVIDRGEIIFDGTPAEVFRHEGVMRTIRG